MKTNKKSYQLARFDYLWTSQQSSDEDKSVACLPDRLKAEIAIHVHLDTLKRVDIFQNTEAGFLCELVLRLKPVLFSPGDFVCRKNEVGLEMYIVSRGLLQVVTDDSNTVVATLRAGSYFGEISVLNVGLEGNRRTASVRSVGYSDLFCLNKQDLWDVLKNHPNAEARIRARAEERLSKLEIQKQTQIHKSHQENTSNNLQISSFLGNVQQQAAAAAAAHELDTCNPTHQYHVRHSNGHQNQHRAIQMHHQATSATKITPKLAVRSAQGTHLSSFQEHANYKHQVLPSSRKFSEPVTNWTRFQARTCRQQQLQVPFNLSSSRQACGPRARCSCCSLHNNQQQQQLATQYELDQQSRTRSHLENSSRSLRLEQATQTRSSHRHHTLTKSASSWANSRQQRQQANMANSCNNDDNNANYCNYNEAQNDIGLSHVIQIGSMQQQQQPDQSYCQTVASQSLSMLMMNDEQNANTIGERPAPTRANDNPPAQNNNLASASNVPIQSEPPIWLGLGEIGSECEYCDLNSRLKTNIDCD